MLSPSPKMCPGLIDDPERLYFLTCPQQLIETGDSEGSDGIHSLFKATYRIGLKVELNWDPLAVEPFGKSLTPEVPSWPLTLEDSIPSYFAPQTMSTLL